MNSLNYCRVAAVVLGLAMGCKPSPQTRIDPEIVAQVGSVSITRSQLEERLEKRRQSGLPVDPKAALDEMVLRSALVERALSLRIDREAEVRNAYENLLIARLKERELKEAGADEQFPATEAPRQDRPVSRVRLAVLRLSTHPKLPEERVRELIAEMETARAAARQLAPEQGFGSLAIRYSDDDSTRYKGGIIGWVDEDPEKSCYDRAALEAGFSLTTPGEISLPVRGRDGFYLVRLIERKTVATATPRAQQRAVADYRTRQRQRLEAEQRFERQVRSAISVTIHEENLPATLAANGESLHLPSVN